MTVKLNEIKYLTFALLFSGLIVLGTTVSCRKDGKKDEKTEQITGEHEEHPSGEKDEHPAKKEDEHPAKKDEEHPKN